MGHTDDRTKYNLGWTAKAPDPPAQLQVQPGPLRMNQTAFRAVDVFGNSEQSFEVLHIEPRGRWVAWRAEQFDRAHPVLDTGSRERGHRFDLFVSIGGAADAPPVNLLRLFLDTPSDTAGKISMVVSLGDGTSWYEEHAFRLSGPAARCGIPAPVLRSEAFQLVCTDDGLSDRTLIDAREWVAAPAVQDRGPGLVYRWIPNKAAKAAALPTPIAATIHAHIQTFGPSDVPAVRLVLA